MNLSLGIVGLPNVGKSTLFNALTKQQVLAANYPFATIDPNKGIVAVNDERLFKIVAIENPKKTVPAVVEFVDIAGLVKGAAEGQGLGNKFLATIRETSAIVHLVRAFNDGNITHVENSVDPKRDIELINTELILKDLETMEVKVKTIAAKARTNAKLQPVAQYMEDLQKFLSEGKLAIDFPQSVNEEAQFERYNSFLLTDKPVIYLVNSSEGRFEEDKKVVQSVVGDKVVIPMDVKTESELAQMNDEERKEFREMLGVEKSGLEILTLEAYKLLGLISFFTAGPDECRAWTIKNGSKAPQAGAAIHTDFEKKFIAADVCASEDYLEAGGWSQAKEVGKVRLEGKEYVVKDGDIMVFRHGS